MKIKSGFLKLPFLTIIAFTIIFITACGSDSTKTNSSSTGGNEDGEETFTLRYNTTYPPSVWDWEPKYKSTEELAKLIEERTEGRVKIEIFYSNQLAGQAESLDALSRGTIDIQNITPSAWSDKVPEGSFSSLPFGWMGEEHASHLLRETDVGKLYEEALDEYGVKVLSYWYSGTSGYLSKKPITGPDDFKGLVMNQVGSNLTAEFYSEMGAGVANIPFAEQYEGLLRGTIDTILFPYYALETYKLSEVVESITVPGPVAPSYGLVAISNKAWDKLPSDLQKIVMDTALEMEEAGIEGSKKLTQMGIDYAEKEGLEINRMTEESYNEFFNLSEKLVWDKYAAINDRTKKIAETISTEREKWIKDNPEAQAYFDEYLAK